MSDLEFQRELSSDQLREALSLLDSAAGVNVQKLQPDDLSPAEEVNRADQPSTTIAPKGRLPAQGPLQRTKHLNLVVFCGLGVAAAATLALLSWSERRLTPPPLPGISHEQLPNQPPAQLVKSASPALAVATPRPDLSPDGSKQLPLRPEVAVLSPVGQASSDDDRAAVKDAANTANGIPYVPQTVTVTAAAMRQAWWEDRASRKPRKLSRYAAAVRVPAEKKQPWRSHWQAHAELNGRECFLFVCLPWQAQRVVYEPPRNVNQ
jgi:hypothetical protein